MKCPHCTVEFHHYFTYSSVGGGQRATDAAGTWGTESDICPSCGRVIIFLVCAGSNGKRVAQRLVYPKGVARSPLPAEVPNEFTEDYREACLVLADSPKASAALSRRCLQHILREAGKTKKKDLADQIDEVMPTLPPHLREMIDAVRVVGNFAAHTIKSTHTGEIIDVEPGEAELLLDVLEMCFDFYFVQPAVAKRKRDAINDKLMAAGKPPMK